MTNDEFKDIWVPARNALYPDLRSRLEASYQMRVALGAQATKEHADFYATQGDTDCPMNEELRNVLLLLNSPYSRTILKAYRIRKGLEGA